MARVGINTSRALGGTSVPALRSMAKRVGKDHVLALELWATGIHEARLLATMVDDPRAVTEAQMEAWVNDFDSWDLADQCCGNLFDRTPQAHRKAVEWSARREEFVKRAGFALMACLAVYRLRGRRGLRGAAGHNRTRGRRSSEPREEGGELGTPPDRQAEPPAERGRDPIRGAHPGILGRQTQLGGLRRPS